MITTMRGGRIGVMKRASARAPRLSETLLGGAGKRGLQRLGRCVENQNRRAQHLRCPPSDGGKRGHFPCSAAALLTTVLLLVGLCAAQADVSGSSAFAALTIEPRGDQVYDLATGITTLADGGTVIDRQSGVTLVADSLRFRDGDFIEAQRARLQAAFGAAAAETVKIDIAAGKLHAGGGVILDRDAVHLEAEALEYDSVSELVALVGSVSASGPTFSAERALLDLRTGTMLLIGPYTFRDGLFTLRSPDAGALLELVPVEPTEPDGAAAYRAASVVAEETLARFAPLLP